MLPNKAGKIGFFKTHLKYAILVLFLVFYQFTNAQINQLDSLKYSLHRIENAKEFEESNIEYINLLNTIAFEYQYKSIDSLKYFSEKAYSLSHNSKYAIGKGNALKILSTYEFYNGNTIKGLKNLESALNIAKQNNNSHLKIGVYLTIGNQQMDLGNHAAALKAYLNALDDATSTKNKQKISILKENIGILYLLQKDYKQALLLYKEANKLNVELGDPNRIAQTQINIADLYIKLKDSKSAATNIDDNIVVFKKAELYEWLAYSYYVKGDIYLNQNNPKLALYWYDKAMVLHEDLSDDRYKVPLINSISEAYYNLKNYPEAEKYAAEALEIATRLSLLDDSIKSYELFYKINKDINSYDCALKYHEKLKLLSDSISRKENLNSLGILKTKMEFEKHAKDAALKIEKEKTKQNIYLYIALIMLSILGLIIFLLKKQSKARKIFNTELQLKTKALKIREGELNTINATKDRLFSIIGHDLKGPINALGSVLNMLKEKEISHEEFEDFVPKFKNDVDAISFTLNNLLSWGRTQMTGSRTEAVKFDIHSLTEENVQLLNEIAESKSISIKNNIVLNTSVWADKNQIDVIIRNLLSNALKFTFEGGLIEISAIPKSNFIEVSIKDNGVGMDSELRNKIFTDKNALISNYGTANEKGTGLGLSLCKEMVENNGGKIWAESVPNKGSVFYFTIPRESK